MNGHQGIKHIASKLGPDRDSLPRLRFILRNEAGESLMMPWETMGPNDLLTIPVDFFTGWKTITFEVHYGPA